MVRKLDKWCGIDWIIFICVTGVITAVCAALFWDNMPLGAQGAVFAAVIMPFHVLEEWKFPGGLHHFYNTLLGPKEKNRQDLNRYPMSRLTDMVTNVGLQWIPLVYLLLSCVTSLSNAVTLCMMLFCFIEVLAHTCAGFMTLHWYKKHLSGCPPEQYHRKGLAVVRDSVSRYDAHLHPSVRNSAEKMGYQAGKRYVCFRGSEILQTIHS